MDFLAFLRINITPIWRRHHNLPFLKATMAACALVATANGEVSFSERVRVDQIIETLEALQVYGPHEAVNIFYLSNSPKDTVFPVFNI